MEYPVINLNGSDGKALLHRYMQAVQSVRETIEAMRDIGVHGRDYQTQAPEVTNKAIGEHCARLYMLESISTELTSIALNLSSQILERSK